jgi:hypothetical protein
MLLSASCSVLHPPLLRSHRHDTQYSRHLRTAWPKPPGATRCSAADDVPKDVHLRTPSVHRLDPLRPKFARTSHTHSARPSRRPVPLHASGPGLDPDPDDQNLPPLTSILTVTVTITIPRQEALDASDQSRRVQSGPAGSDGACRTRHHLPDPTCRGSTATSAEPTGAAPSRIAIPGCMGSRRSASRLAPSQNRDPVLNGLMMKCFGLPMKCFLAPSVTVRWSLHVPCGDGHRRIAGRVLGTHDP